MEWPFQNDEGKLHIILIQVFSEVYGLIDCENYQTSQIIFLSKVITINYYHQ